MTGTLNKLAEGFNLIEGPVWDPSLGLIFSDAVAGGVFALSETGDVKVVFEHRKGIGGITRHESAGLVVSGRNISFKPFDGGKTIALLDRDESVGITGFNDITTDNLGRIYAGSLGSNSNGTIDSSASGKLFLINIDGSATAVATDIKFNNGLAFSPDGKTLYHSDTLRGRVFSYSVNADGTLGEKKSFARVPSGAPDGLVVSEDGRVWVALAGGGHGVSVYHADGTDSEFVKIPQPMCTSLCFGGDDLKTLFIVSGSEGMGSDKAGAVYSIKTGATGMPVAAARVELG